MNKERMKRAADYFSQMQSRNKDMFESRYMGDKFGRGKDLAEWNREQYALWLEVKKFLPELTEMEELELFTAFAKYFYEYFIQHPGDIPDVEEVLDHLSMIS